MREFDTSNRRHWTVAQLEGAQSGTILRFTSGDGLTFELGDWPQDWVSSSDDALAELLWRAVLLTSQRNAARTAATY